MAEQDLRISVMLSHGDLSIFVTRPISLIFLLITVINIITGQRKSRKLKQKQAKIDSEN